MTKQSLRKRVLIAAAAFAVMLLVCGCKSTKRSFDYAAGPHYTYPPEADVIDAEIALPEGWRDVRQDDVFSNIFASENVQSCYSDETAMIVLAKCYSGADPLSEYVRDVKESLEDNTYGFLDFAFISADGIVPSGSDREYLAYKAMTNGQDTTYWYVFVQREHFVFEIICTAPTEQFARYHAVFNSAFASIRFTEK